MARDATTSQARRLRRTATYGERVLWRLLRGRRLGDLKFRRQVPIGPYVADFACLEHRLIVEIDGPFHDPGRDARRDDWLKAQGFRVLRFSDGEVTAADHRVTVAVLKTVEDRLPPHPTR